MFPRGDRLSEALETKGHPVNSRAWWDEFFERQWDANGGTAQTRHFMERLIASIPDVDLSLLQNRQLSILDWGCALGEGVHALAERFPRARVVGLDFSREAIETARQRHGYSEFIHTPNGEIPEPFDVIVTSNCLEHFDEPIELLRKHLTSCRELYVALVPYDESPLCQYHRSSFRESSFPDRIDRFEKLCARRVKVEQVYWPGEQLLVMYGAPTWRAAREAEETVAAERAKWDQYYSSLPMVNEDEATRRFNDDFARLIGELLPSGAAVLEAGCGGGWQSLALARSGRYRVSLLDFSAEALEYTRKLFDREGARAEFIHEDVFSPARGQYDLVFNAGVLEHYTFEEQVAFIRAMAARSVGYVLVLVPNRWCYWYWIWRIQKAARGDWPFGKEVPQVDLSAVFEAAGLDFLGHSFLGESWTEGMISGMHGLDEKTRDEILKIHRSQIIPQAEKGYLVAALGAISPHQGSVPAAWHRHPFQETLKTAEVHAALADAMALRLGCDQRMTHAEQLLAEAKAHGSESIVKAQALSAALAALQSRYDADKKMVEQARELESRILGTQAEAAALRQMVQVLEQRRRSVLRTSIDLSWSVARSIYLLFPESVRYAVKDRFYSVFGKLRPHSGRYHQYLAWKRKRQHERRIASQPTDVIPDPVESGPRPFDVFIFPVIDWEFRHQRPQQLALQLAASGHRVFYFRTTFVSDQQYEPALHSLAPNVFNVALPCAGKAPVIYSQTLEEAQRQSVSTGIEKIREKVGGRAALCIVDHPFWTSVAESMTNARVVYDCMDHHAGFSNNNEGVLALEKKLLEGADLVVASSQRLVELISDHSKHTALIRNGGEFDHFATRPAQIAFEKTRPVIGYYGAIAEWFDGELLAAAAKAMPDCDFVLVGSTFGADLSSFEKLPNVRMFGEVPYADLPRYLHGFDVCTIPFKVCELTLATNPVKVYEYLAAAKPVVTVDLPELRMMQAHIRIADSRESFIRHLREALTEDKKLHAEGWQAFAKDNTWRARGDQLETAVAPLFPKVSILMLTYNQLTFTRSCLASLERFTNYPDWELVIVDNASADGTPAFLRDYAASRPHVRLILNETNRGFAAGNNQAAKAATGEYFVFLNNDTYVTNGWLTDLLAHYRREPGLGLLNPVTNNIGNEAKIELSYDDMIEMADTARQYTEAHRGRRLEMARTAFFCVMIPRCVWEQIGEMDEGYGIGFFEDDDYSERARRKGYKMACAEDVFVHHHLSASFNALTDISRRELFEKNKAYYESKWGRWKPHEYRKAGARS